MGWFVRYAMLTPLSIAKKPGSWSFPTNIYLVIFGCQFVRERENG